MLASMDIRDAHVFLSCRNPGDATGRADIDVVVVSGRTVWLLDAKHYRPASPDAYLVPTPGLDAMRGGGELRAYDSNTNLNVPVGSLAGVAPVRTYHASGNMAWAADSVRSGLPAGLDVRPSSCCPAPRAACTASCAEPCSPEPFPSCRPTHGPPRSRTRPPIRGPSDTSGGY